MKKCFSQLPIPLVLLLLGLLPTAPFASAYGSNMGQPPPPAPPPQRRAKPDNSAAIAADQAAIKSAQQAFEDAKSALDKVVADHQIEFEKTKPWLDAQAQLSQTQTEYQAARNKTLLALTSQSDYQAASADARKASSDLADAKSSGAPPDVVAPLAQDSLQASGKVAKMEQDALSQDDNVTAARKNVESAQAQANGLLDQFKQSIQVNEDWKSANTSLQTAQKQLADAQAKLDADERS